MGDRQDGEPARFIPLDDYARPDEPAVDVLQRVWQRARRVVSRRGEKRAVEEDRLRHASHETIDEATAAPDCSLLARELDATLAGWLAETSPTNALRLVVTPPCDVRGLLETWARRGGHEVLSPPAPDALLVPGGAERGTPGPPDIDGDGVLVVPRLEQWFLRHRRGLAHVRALLGALGATERRCVIGCSSWAWRFLKRAVEADLVLPRPLVFAPFDAERLHRWFGELVGQGGAGATFRETRTGGDVFARDADGRLESDYLEGLAARSLGIPWVAWPLWLRSLRTVQDGEASGRDVGESRRGAVAAGKPRDGDARDGDARDGADGSDAMRAVRDEDDEMLWLVRPDEIVLPHGHERTSRLVLHALLLHGSLDGDSLHAVLPLVGESRLVPALARAGFVERVGGRYRCVPAAYPSIVESLATAGFPMPEI